MEFVQQHWNPAKTQCSLRNFGQKNPLKPKKIICVDLPIFRQDNYQNATNQLKLKCTISAKYYAKVDKNVQFGWKTSFCFSAKMSLFQF